VFMSTHTLAMAEEMADRMGIMVQGKIKFLGTVSELRQQVDVGNKSLESLAHRSTNPCDDLLY